MPLRPSAPLRLSAIGLLCVVCLLRAPAPAAAAPWTRVETPAFIIVGDVDVKTLQALAVQFERFREALSQIVSDGATASAVPTIVFAFSAGHMFNRYRPIQDGKPVPVDGFAFSALDANYIALPLSARDKALRTIFHEYAHVVINAKLPGLPAWLSEGLADYYSTFDLRDKGRRVVVGGHIFEHQRLLEETPILALERLFAIGRTTPSYHETSRRDVFYAQSWALVHMLLRTPDRAARLGKFARAVSTGTPEADAWTQFFNTEEIERAHKIYVWQRVYAPTELPLAERTDPPVEAPVTMADAELQVMLGSLLFRVGRLDEADAVLLKMSRVAGVERLTKATQALIHLAQNRSVAGRQLLAGVEASDTDHWLASYFAAVGHDLAMRRGLSPDAATIAGAQRMVAQVLAQRPNLPHALHLDASLRLAANTQLDEAVQSIERARALAPGREDYLATHAELLIRLKQFAAARKMIEPIAAGKGWPTLREWAQLALRRIKLAEPD